MDNNAKLSQVVATIFNVDPSSITEDSSVDTIEQWDSLNHLKLVLALEQEFDVSFTEEETVDILNFQLIKMTLEEHGVNF